MWVLIFIAAVTVIVLVFDAIKKKVNRSVVSADRYERQKFFTNQVMLIETSASYNQVYSAMQNVFEPKLSAAEAFKGGQYKLLSRYQNKLTYEHMASMSAFADGDGFQCSFSFFTKENKLLLMVQVERWKVSSGVARKTGIDAMEDFFNKARAVVFSVDANAYVKFSGIDQEISLSGYTAFDLMNVKQERIHSVSATNAVSFCSKCGTKIEADGMFCPKCGNKIK